MSKLLHEEIDLAMCWRAGWIEGS